MLSIFTELSDTSSRETKSDTWPMQNERDNRSKEVKRRFSWENLAKSKDSTKRSKPKRRRHKFMLPLNFGAAKKLSPPKSSTKSTFKTSTPLKSEKEISQKVSESGFGSSSSISQVTFAKPINAQTTTCSDRLGVPKTSLNDFKKLLLNATNKQRMSTKPSAVEQLKLKHDALNASSPMKILDLSSSPKSFMNRRILQPAQNASSSPYKKIMSPRSRWKYSNFNKNTIASIPEANFEDDVATATISVVSDKQTLETTAQNLNELQNNPIYATPQKKLTSIPENIPEMNISVLQQQTPSVTANEAFEPIIAKTESSPETGVIETNFTLQENIFLQAEENNFMPGEIKPFGRKALGRKLVSSSEDKPEEKTHEQTEIGVAAASSMPTLETSF